MARFDERLWSSPIRDGWITHPHFAEAAAGLWRDGELVYLEDLVVHHIGGDIRAPTRCCAPAAASRGQSRIGCSR